MLTLSFNLKNKFINKFLYYPLFKLTIKNMIVLIIQSN